MIRHIIDTCAEAGVPTKIVPGLYEIVGGDVQVSRIRDVDVADLLADDGTVAASRVTAIGRLLRRLGLDELPQLVNVARGQMSLVGPGPILPDWVDRLPSGSDHPRFPVPPGLTGPAQVAGRNMVMWSRRMELDARYVRNGSLATNLLWLERTPWSIVASAVSDDHNKESVDHLDASTEVADEHPVHVRKTSRDLVEYFRHALARRPGTAGTLYGADESPMASALATADEAIAARPCTTRTHPDHLLDVVGACAIDVVVSLSDLELPLSKGCQQGPHAVGEDQPAPPPTVTAARATPASQPAQRRPTRKRPASSGLVTVTTTVVLKDSPPQAA